MCVVLVGRRGPDAALRERLAGLESETGCRLETVQAEVGEAEQVEGLLARFARSEGEEAEWPRLAGIFHAAGVTDDGIVTGQTAARFEGVFRAKAWGAWHLHRVTLDRELDLFVLYSSVSAVLGSAGQSSYAAANGFLDGLAALRASAGLAGTSAAWGAWGGGGLAAREKAAAVAAQMGLLPMTADRAHAGLDRMLRSGRANGVVVEADWRRMGGFLGRRPLLSGLLPRTEAEEGGLLERVGEATVSDREGMLLGFVQRELQAALQMSSLPDPGVGFFDLGMDSLMAVELRNRLNRGLGGSHVLSSTVVFDYASPQALARHLAEVVGVLAPARARAVPRRTERGGEEGVAVVGLACRFPGGSGLAEFWRLLESGGDAITEGRAEPVGRGEAPDMGWGGFIEGVDLFDAEFFRIAPVEAPLLDPQQRLLLETSWEALESAGIDAGRLRGSRTGVYAGISTHDYWDLLVAGGTEEAANLYLESGNSGSTAVGRVAFTLGLEGPALTVDTACSSSLVAVHQAAVCLQRGDADLALAGGVNVLLSPMGLPALRNAGMLSPDGRCKTFDSSANGFVKGEGCGMVVLKRLRDAEADGDRIWGVICGSAVNHDGASAGLTVPNGPAQERVIEEALGRAGLEPWEVDYLEAHGTGTELGDPIEVNAAAAVYGAGREPARPLLLGSVKTNVGHLQAAAGVAGLVKVLLSMAHGVIPRSLHFREPNPQVEWDRLPVQVVSEPAEWPSREGRPARAGVSSFGLSGTNAHVVVEAYGQGSDAGDVLLQAGRAVTVPWPENGLEPGPVEASGDGSAASRTRRLLALSGRTDEALRALAGRYLEWLDGAPDGCPRPVRSTGIRVPRGCWRTWRGARPWAGAITAVAQG